MTVYALWNGGPSYAAGYLPEDLESFPDIEAAKDALEDRARNGHWIAQEFNYINRPGPERAALCPTVTDSYMDVYFEDPSEETDTIPDIRLKQQKEPA